MCPINKIKKKKICGKVFTQKGSLMYHSLIHKGEKNFICDVCDFRARSNHDLKIHKKKHTENRQYICNICAFAFKTSSNLQKHLRRHTGIKDFKVSTKKN